VSLHFVRACNDIARLASPAQAQLFKIINPQFSEAVGEDYAVIGGAQNRVLSHSRLARAGRVYYSFTVLGDEATCKYLRDNEQLEIRVDLFDALRVVRSYRLDITQHRWGEIGSKISGRCSAERMFTYRTFLFTSRIDVSTLTAHVRDVDARTVSSESVTIEP
jgi:hypothetical protein